MLPVETKSSAADRFEAASRKCQPSDEAWFSFGPHSQELKFAARKSPEGDSGNQSGERSKHFSSFTPDCKLAIHGGLPGRSPRSVVGRNKSRSSPRVVSVQHQIIAPSVKISKRFLNRRIQAVKLRMRLFLDIMNASCSNRLRTRPHCDKIG